MTKEYSAVVSVRYMIDDVDAAVAFYTNHLGFALDMNAAPAFASVTRGSLRLLLSGEKSSGRKAMPDRTKPVPGGWNRILLEVTDIQAEAARLRAAGVGFLLSVAVLALVARRLTIPYLTVLTGRALRIHESLAPGRD